MKNVYSPLLTHGDFHSFYPIVLRVTPCVCVIYKRKRRTMAESRIITQIIAGFAATMSLAGAGFEYGWPTPSLPKLLAPESSIPLTSSEGSWVVSVFTIGCAIGSFIGAVLVDRWGRKSLLLFTVAPHLVAGALIGAAQDVWWLICARIIGGLGAGIAFTVVPMYAGEIAEDRIRGAVSGMLDPVVNISVVITYCVGPWVSPEALAGVGGILPLVFGAMFIWMPESPYFFMMKDKPNEAEKSLMWLRRRNDVSEELRMIKDNVEAGRENIGTMQDLITTPGNRRALIIIVGIMVAQQFSGISALAYSSLIFKASGSKLDSSISVIIVGVVQTLSGLLAVFIVDLVGRRVLLLTSAFGSVIFLAGMATYYQLQALGIDVSSISWLPVTAMIGFILIFTIGLGALPYVVLSEIFPCNVKALAMMVANITGAIFAMAATKFYQIVADSYGISASFWGFAGLTVFSVIFIYLFVPETNQRSLQDIHDELHKITQSKIALNRCED